VSVRALAVATCVLGLLAAPPPGRAAEPGDSGERGPWEVGALLGGGFYQINTPQDPPGALTFLYGSAFSGGGFIGGATAVFEPHPLLGAEADLLFSRTSLSGSAETTDQRREVSLQEVDLRLALLGRLHIPLPNPEIELGLGVELAVGLGSAVAETIHGNVGPETPLQTDTGTWLLPIGQLGVDIHLGRFTVPILARVGWNPAYPDRTDERFASLADPNAPGPLTVGADWYVSGFAGLRFAL
jgi:hypothetical protein